MAKYTVFNAPLMRTCANLLNTNMPEHILLQTFLTCNDKFKVLPIIDALPQEIERIKKNKYSHKNKTSGCWDSLFSHTNRKVSSLS